MNIRNKVRRDLAEKYELLFPEELVKNDENFRKVYDENLDELNAMIDAGVSQSGIADLLKKILASNFVY